MEATSRGTSAFAHLVVGQRLAEALAEVACCFWARRNAGLEHHPNEQGR